jgi:hypothetical protein
VLVCYKADAPDAKKPAWPGGRPRFGFVVKGKLCYDPRKDSTVAAGSGAHRWEDPSTWEWSENPVVCRYNWVRGIYAEDDVANPTALLVGRGLTAEEAPPENIIAAANLCDEALTGPRPYTERDGPGIGSLFATSITGGWLALYDTSGRIDWWNLATRTFLGSSTDLDAFSGSVANIDLASDGTAYFHGWYISGASAVSALWTCPPLGTATRVDADEPFLAGRTRVFDLAGGTRKILTAFASGSAGSGGYFDGSSIVADAQFSIDFCLHGDGSIWGLFEPDATSDEFTLKRLTGTPLSYTVTGLVSRGAPDDQATLCHVASEQHFVVISDGKFYLVNDDTSGSPGTIKASGAFTGETLNLPRKDPSQTQFWSAFDLVSLVDMSTIETVDPGDWVGANPDLGFVEALYDPMRPAIVTDAGSTVTWRDLGTASASGSPGRSMRTRTSSTSSRCSLPPSPGTSSRSKGRSSSSRRRPRAVAFSFTDDDLVVGSRSTGTTASSARRTKNG